MDSRPVLLCGLRNRPQRDALRYLSVLRVGNLAYLLFTAAGALPVLTMGGWGLLLILCTDEALGLGIPIGSGLS